MKRPLDEAETFRAHELLLDRAMYGLASTETAELAALGADTDDSFDLAAAALDLATLRLEAMPAGLADQLLAAAEADHPLAAPRAGTDRPLAAPRAGAARPATPAPSSAVPSTLASVVPARAINTQSPHLVEPLPVPAQAPVTPIRRSRAPLIAAWFTAAASLALAVGAMLWARDQKPPAVTAAPAPAQARAELLAAASDAAMLAWKPTADAAARGASGDVVWSPSKQRGYMRFRGLAPNDPKISQYQLWIFDQQRDESFPVDGGVFDVASTDEVILPISAKLQVGGAVLFAVTVERPGGVVVSKRERIVVTAAPT